MVVVIYAKAQVGPLSAFVYDVPSDAARIPTRILIIKILITAQL